jgi:hypothetical protein
MVSKLRCNRIYLFNTRIQICTKYLEDILKDNKGIRHKENNRTAFDINVCLIPVKTDVGQVDLVSQLSDGTSEKMTVLPFEGYFL